MTTSTVDDAEITDILTTSRVIAVVGASPDPSRDSNRVMGFLKQRGYRVIPVNPTSAGEEVHGERILAALQDIDEPVDMVDVFRRSDSVGPIVQDAIAIGARVVWMQLGVVNEEAAQAARAAGLRVVMNRCPRIEIPRLQISGPA
jgi:uncharacterized protein